MFVEAGTFQHVWELVTFFVKEDKQLGFQEIAVQHESSANLKFQRSFGVFLKILIETLSSVVFQLEC